MGKGNGHPGQDPVRCEGNMAQVISNLGSRGTVRQSHSSYISEGLVALFNRINDWSERRRTRNHLYQMPDYILHDIGVSRAEVEGEYEKPFWKA
jgi:uncharacterized protein YjiS (DUF1127 family)